MKTNIITYIITLLVTFHLNSQTINQEIAKDGETPYLLGKIDKNGLEGENYAAWFTKNHEDYQPNPSLITDIASELKTYSITLFMGTWCGDSKQEVPKLYKVLEACSFPMNQLTVIAVSRQPDMYKQSPQHEEKGLNIHRVPTVIFYKDGKEVNRIVEHPVKTFEEDIQNIITVNDYKSNYQIVAAVDNILKKKSAKGLKKKTKKLLKAFDGKVSSMHELNTYAYILFNTDRQSEAIEVSRINTKLFPEEPNAFISLANKLSRKGDTKKAIKALKKVLKLDPENEQAKKSIEALKSN